MKILLLNTTELKGGAAIAAHRLYLGLRKNGVDAKMLVLEKQTNDPNVIQLYNNKLLKKILSKIHYYRKKYFSPDVDEFSDIFSLNHIIKRVNSINPDIVHLHWINYSFFNINDLNKLSFPIVWTLHDMWPFTGGCHYSNECRKYIKNCEHCPKLNVDNNNLSNKIYKKKRKIYENLDINLLSPSKWLASLAKKSSLFFNKKICTIPNCLDTDIYKPINKKFARNKLDLPLNSKLLLFGAIGGEKNPRKGFEYIIKSLELLQTKTDCMNNIKLVIFGNSNNSSTIKDLPFKINNFGRITNEKRLVLIYSAADIFIAPSVEEAFGQTITEAMACGTPVVSFKHSGPKEIITHKENGYLAEYKSHKDLTTGMIWAINNKKRNKNLSMDARESVLKYYSEKAIIPSYINFYKNLL